MYSNQHNVCFYLFFNIELEFVKTFALSILILTNSGVTDLLQRPHSASSLEHEAATAKGKVVDGALGKILPG